MEGEENLGGGEVREAESAKAVKLVVEIEGFYGFGGIKFG